LSIPEIVELESFINIRLELSSSESDKKVFLDSFVFLDGIELNSKIVKGTIDLISNFQTTFILKGWMKDKDLDKVSLIERNIILRSIASEKTMSLESLID